MPEVTVEKQPVLDLLTESKPGLSTTTDMPIIETKPDVVVKKPAAAAPEGKPEGETKDVSATPDQPESASADPEAPKAKGVQKRLDELTRNWRDEQRAREATQKQLSEALEMLKRAGDPKPVETKTDADDPEPAEPDASKYTDQEKYNADYRGYLKGMARWEGRQEFKSQQRKQAEETSKRTREEQVKKSSETYLSHATKARTKYPDYDDVTGANTNPALVVTHAMADAIVEMGENGPDVAYYLGKNPEESQRIANLSPRAQFLELGAIKATLKSEVVKPSVSQAKPPIKPLQSGSGAAASSSDEESMEAYAAKRAKQLAEERRPGRR